MLATARLTVRAQQVDSIELGAHTVAAARDAVERNITSSDPNPSEDIGQVDGAAHSSFAVSLFKVVESLRVVVDLVDKTAKVDISIITIKSL